MPNQCFYPICKLTSLWDVYLEDYKTLIHRACLEHVGHAIAAYQCSTDQEPVRENYAYIVRRSLE